MTGMTQTQRQRSINDFIRDLSKITYSQDELIEKSRILLPIYLSGEFRHSYSQILGTIYSLREGEDIIYLTSNIEELKTVYKNPIFIPIKRQMEKLCDHVELELTRMAQLEKINAKQADLDIKLRVAFKDYSESIKNMGNIQNELTQETEKLELAKEELIRVNKDLAESKQKLETSVKDTENLKSEVITVIGIFAAIMLAFVGGMSFTSSTLTSMHNSSIYKVVFVAIICGFVVFNTIFCLMYIVSRMTNRDIYAECHDGNCEKDCVKHYCQYGCSAINRIRKRLPYVFWVNLILLILLLIIIVCWVVDIKSFNDYIQKLLWGRL